MPPGQTRIRRCSIHSCETIGNRAPIWAGSRAIKRLSTKIVLALLVIGAIALAVQETLFWLDHVYEANAKIQSNFTVLSSSVNGNIDQVHVKRGDLVEEGALLASMKTDAAELEVALREADLERERAVRVQVQEELSFFRSELDDKIATAEASVGLLKEEFATLNERLAIARKNVARSNALQTRAVVPKQRVDDANDKMLEIQSKLRDTETDAKISEKRL